MKRSKKYNEVAAKVIKDHLYTPLQAVTLAKETTTTKYDSTIEVAAIYFFERFISSSFANSCELM